MSFQSCNPATGEVLRTFEETSAAELAQMLDGVRPAQRSWRRTSFDRRADLLRRLAGLLERDAASLARLMALEMGKPVRQGRAEMEKCAWVCRYYADEAKGFLQPQTIATEGLQSRVVFEPLGTVLAIMPWNFPFWQVFRFAAPALMAGNCVVMKHAPNVPQCAAAIAQLLDESGFPPLVLNNLMVQEQRVAEVIQHEAIAAVTLTGSTAAGRAVAATAGAALKKTVLELGGSDPYLILADADLESAVPICVTARMINGGQSCIAAKRFIVVQELRHRFEQLLVDGMRRQRLGDPLDEQTDLGPLARHDLRDTLHRQVQDSIEQGARCLLGGELPVGDGAYYPPTVLTDVAAGMPAFEQELFGPVAAIVPVRDDDEAVAVANDSAYGLGAAVFTRNVDKGLRLAADELEAGCCFVNTMVRSDPRLPFGGIKQSGFGRELSQFGIREFVNVKTVCAAS